ncbi:MAG: LysR family substrate-binding domain-containing protein [Rhodococcus sp. (in: high G+C Gram-positive bacteria)]|uniref:LysR family substrate-binding domain-containing protein n=1 Tax=Rhodococcus sp. TaxID=1831 RepID=UPI003BB1B7E2
MTDAEAPRSFRLAYVPGVTPTKWVRIWNDRLPDVALSLVATTPQGAADALREGAVDMALVRLPIDRTGLDAITLYAETPVVVVPNDHVATAVQELTTDDLADETMLHPLDDALEWERRPGKPAEERPETTADGIEWVAAGVGLLVVPQSLARLHHRKDLTYRTVTDAPESVIALSWPRGETTDLVEEFIGIVRGRTTNSSRGASAPAKSLKAADKARLKRERRAATSNGKSVRSTGGAAKGRPGQARKKRK